MSRLPLLESHNFLEEYHLLFTDDFLGDRHIIWAWAHNPEVLEATPEYPNMLYDQLGQRRKELVILTVARARRARYEWHQHGNIARDKGVTIAEIQAISGGDLSVFDDAEYVLLQYARAVESGTVTDQIHAALTRHYSSVEIVTLGLLVDFCVGLCNYIASVDPPFEGGAFVGWIPEEETVAERFE
jgi:alkylhydroperoxidase family enzyme